jgi:glycogen(starch) synthase
VKVLHFIYDHLENPWVAGGGAVRAREIYRRLAERHDITVVCGKYPGARDYEEGRLRFRFVGTDRDSYVLSTFCYALGASLYLMKHRRDADVVVEDFAPYNPVFSPFLRSDAIVQVHHREGGNLLRRYYVLGLPFLLAEAFYPRLFRRSVCVSEASRSRFGLTGGAVISNGIDPSLLDVESTGEDHVAYLGRLHIHNKGLDTLAGAMGRVDERLALAGKGKDGARLKELFERAGAGRRVEFLGHLEEGEKRRFLAGSKFLVLPSRYEGQGIVVIEAAALGKAVVVSDIPELSFAVREGFGISFRTGDAGDLADKIGLLAGDGLLRQGLADRGRLYASRHTWDRAAAEFEDYLLESGGRR